MSFVASFEAESGKREGEGKSEVCREGETCAVSVGTKPDAATCLQERQWERSEKLEPTEEEMAEEEQQKEKAERKPALSAFEAD